jgi:hypothetical protein
MRDDPSLEEQRSVLQKLLIRVPTIVCSGGIMTTRQYRSDVKDAFRAMAAGRLSRINESIEVMRVWHSGQIPHYHPIIE